MPYKDLEKRKSFMREYAERNRARINETRHNRVTDAEYDATHPGRRAANRAISSAVRYGRLSRAYDNDCFVCGDDAKHWHHVDYNKPLEVFPMCQPCHQRWHRHNQPIERNDES
jgi:hypothetical protein